MEITGEYEKGELLKKSATDRSELKCKICGHCKWKKEWSTPP